MTGFRHSESVSPWEVCLRSVISLISAVLFALPALANAASAADLESRRKALDDLLHEQWEYTLKTNPTYASILGDKRYNDKLEDFSQRTIDEEHEYERRLLPRLEAIDTTGFPDQEVLNKELMIRDIKLDLEGVRFKLWEMPVSQNDGPHVDLPQLPNLLSFDSVKDYEDYISRLKQMPRLFDQTVVQMRKGMAENLMPPKLLLEKVVTQCGAITNTPAEKSPFAAPFDKFPDSISEADRKRLREAGIAAIHGSVFPAYTKFAVFVRDEYAPKGRSEPGIWALPNGAELYAYRVKSSTTTNLTPEEIHEIGLEQVRLNEARTLEVAKQLGFSDLKSFYASIPKNPRLHVHSREEILDLYRKYIDQMYTKLPDLFGRLPKGRVDVLPIEEFREKEAATHYLEGTADGSRKAHVMVNTGDFENRTTTEVETTAYHEGVPGHHLQISIAMELPTLPPFRQHENYTAYTEGWALYSEELGKEAGFFQDPYSYYGHLEDDMLRAIRLVVDTGFHYKHWSRQQVVDFFHEHSSIDEPDVQSETDRYSAWPAQALGYKIGQLEILKLRKYAKDELGAKFDVRAFHDEVLGGGALPMDVLSNRIHEWVAQEKAQGEAPAGNQARGGN
jgi:uncharacterized protein (DUF885 family)